MKRNIDQANLPPPSGLMPRFGRPWMVKKSVNPLRTMQGSQLSGATATEATADGPELRLQSSLDSAAVGRPVIPPCGDAPTQEGFVPRRTVDREGPSTQDPAPPSLFIPPWSQVSQPQSQVETEGCADTQPTPVTNAPTPGYARPSQAAAKLLEEITYKTLGLPDASALARAETQTLLAKLEALETKQEHFLTSLKENLAESFSDLKTNFSQALQRLKDDVVHHLIASTTRVQRNEEDIRNGVSSVHSMQKKAEAKDAGGGGPGSSSNCTAQAQGPMPHSSGRGNKGNIPSSSSVLSIRSSFKSCISSRNAGVYEESETKRPTRSLLPQISSDPTDVICILDDEEQDSGTSEDLPRNFLRHRISSSRTRACSSQQAG